jgi:hypothetical protein
VCSETREAQRQKADPPSVRILSSRSLKPIEKTFAGLYREARDQPSEGAEHIGVSSEVAQFRHPPPKIVGLCGNAP